LGSNHHLEIVETKDEKGQPRWEGKVVSMYEAMRRLKAGEPVVRRDRGPDKKFLFSLAGGETVEVEAEHGKRELHVVEKVTKRGQGERERCTVGIVPVGDARTSDERELREPSAEVLRNKGCRKVVITPLGEVRRASD
jgi:CRISPR-associated endonuclease Csn1